MASEYNGLLEVTSFLGKKVLDSANTNYSYGALQSVLQWGLSKIDLSNVQRILLLGLGGGCVIETLRETFHCNAAIVAVEIDKVVIQVAEDEFYIKENDKLRIIHEDAIHYISQCKEKVDLIIVDIFIDKHIPEALYSPDFWANISSITQPKGFLLFNAAVTNMTEEKEKNLISYLEKKYELNVFIK